MKLVWFRRDLRIEDNSALVEACRSGQPVVAIYISTPQTWQEHHLSAIQADLIYRRLFELQRDLAQLNISLHYAQVATFRQSAELIADVASESKIDEVLVNKEYELNESIRDSYLAEQLASSSVTFTQLDDKCLFRPNSVLNKQGNYFKVFTPFKKAAMAKWYEQPTQVRMPAVLEHSSQLLNLDQLSSDIAFDYPRSSSDIYPVETKKVINLLRSFNAQQMDLYAQQRDFPIIDGTSKLSPYLAIGAISARQCVARMMMGSEGSLTQGREVWFSELLWRDFYQHLVFFETKLSRSKSFLKWGDKLTWDNNEKYLEAWKCGQTGYPIVDSAMRQLNRTGWMHNRLRMVVASFLVKDLHIDWRHGEAYFMSQLVDGDYASNNGGWQWCASTGCDGQPYFRIFNPTSQGERFDADGEFVRKWVPELESVPKKFIHQPWKWSGSHSLDYPDPIVDHKREREITLQLYQQARDED